MHWMPQLLAECRAAGYVGLTISSRMGFQAHCKPDTARLQEPMDPYPWPAIWKIVGRTGLAMGGGNHHQAFAHHLNIPPPGVDLWFAPAGGVTVVLLPEVPSFSAHTLSPVPDHAIWIPEDAVGDLLGAARVLMSLRKPNYPGPWSAPRLTPQDFAELARSMQCAP